MPAKVTGGCACGAIRYEVTADPIVMFNCHCRDCQKAIGDKSASRTDLTVVDPNRQKQ